MRSLLVVLVAGCGRLGFDPITTSDGPSDATVDLPLVSVDPATLPPFGTATMVAELSTPGAEEDDPSLTRDQLEIFFDRGENDLFTSRRAAVTDPWSPPTPITRLNTPATEEHPHVSADGLRLFFTSGRTGEASLYVTERADRESDWSDPVTLDLLNSSEDEDNGGANALETALVFSSNRGGQNQHDLYETQRADIGAPWGTPVEIINTSTNETGPHLDDFGLVMHYQRGQSIVWVQRASLADPWSTFTTLGELDVPGDNETDPWLSPDLRTIYFTRETPSGAKDIYMATR